MKVFDRRAKDRMTSILVNLERIIQTVIMCPKFNLCVSAKSSVLRLYRGRIFKIPSRENESTLELKVCIIDYT